MGEGRKVEEEEWEEGEGRTMSLGDKGRLRKETLTLHLCKYYCHSIS